VLHPPVDTDFFTPGPPIHSRGVQPAHGGFALVVSALVPYKRLDVAIGAAARAGRPLTIVGSGPDEARLRGLADASVTFAGNVSPEALRDLYRSAAVLILPGEEDFGIAPVEALACGCPVVALARGGVTETVEHGVTGLLVDELSAGAFAAALAEVAGLPSTPDTRRASAERFAAAHFDEGFTTLMTEMLQPC
jgi:glycosyltransferase involved in cell wall biosynthesis